MLNKHYMMTSSFVWGIHRSKVNSPHKGKWRGALMFSLICVWIKGWANNREAGDLRRYRAHYDVTVMNWTRWNTFGNTEPLWSTVDFTHKFHMNDLILISDFETGSSPTWKFYRSIWRITIGMEKYCCATKASKFSSKTVANEHIYHAFIGALTNVRLLRFPTTRIIIAHANMMVTSILLPLVCLFVCLSIFSIFIRNTLFIVSAS